VRARLRSAPATQSLIDRLPAGEPVAVVRDGGRTVLGLGASDVVTASRGDAFPALESMTSGWWAGFLSYDLGRMVERVAPVNAETSIPDVAFARFDTRIVVHPDGEYTVEGDAGAAERLIEGHEHAPAGGPPLEWESSLDRAGHAEAVARIHEHLLDGDCYQVNLTRTLATRTPVDARALFAALRAGNPAPHEAFVRVGGVEVVSASPECFLRVDGRRVTTRPIKGTGADPAALAASAKDRAENVMIVDLARNDLGRVCEYGSVRVPELFAVEEHPGLYHLVSTVEGTLRGDVGFAQLVRATFPPASVTGCPKPRVLQIIEDVEPVRRGVYCGAVGFVDTDRGISDLNVAIRTFTIAAGRTTFSVGGAIVADSDAEAEWRETELKAARLLRIAGAR
jgi:para-aminobenzoate synthetase component 1